MPGPLAGIRVLDMGAFGVGPQACGLLGTLGAEVIRIEPDYIDGLARVPPLIGGTGSTYLGAHHNSKNIILGLKDNDESRDLAFKIIRQSDILIENRRTGALDRLGFGYDAVSKVNPAIIYASSAAYGHTGPFTKFGGADHFIQAMSGFVSLNGKPGGPPEWCRYVALVDGTGSIVIAQACIVALRQRQRTGRGQYIDLDEFSSCLFLESTRLADYLATGREPERRGSESAVICPSRAYLTQDGRYVLVSAFTRAHWSDLCAALEMTELIDDERFRTNDARLSRRAEVNRIIQSKIGDKPLVWWLWQLERHDVPFSPILGVEELMRDPHVRENELIKERASVYGPMKYSYNVPWAFEKAGSVPVEPPPAFDADRDYIVSLARARPREPAATTGVGPCEPLQGLRVLDMTQGIAGPACTAQLGTLGAEVIKVEKPGGDYARSLGPAVNGESAIFMQHNHDKKSVVVDYTTAEGAAVVRDLAKSCDVFIEDLRPGEAEVLKLGYRDLCRFKKDLIYCSLSLFGERGPYRKRAATELEIQGMSGMMGWLGEPGGEPVRVGADVYSSLTGLLTAIAVLAAIHNHRGRHTGERISISSFGVAMYMILHGIIPLSGTENWAGYWVTGPYDRPQTGFQTADKPIMFSMIAKSDKLARSNFENFCRRIGLEAMLNDKDFVDKGVRAFNSGQGLSRDARELRPVLEKVFKNWRADDLVNLITECGGMAAPVLSFKDLFEPVHEQVTCNRMTVEQNHPRAGKVTLISNPWRHGIPAFSFKRPSPGLGEHTREVLASLAGYPETRIGNLERAGVVKTG
ncbi:MAG: CoA transferase [Chloroflexi bacterium]|nr:CoA transferase [Chloroflexota bacterium]